MKFLFTFLMFVSVIFNHSNASIVSAVPPGGDWSNAGTWDGSAPGCYDTIVIPVGASVNMASTIDLTACPATKMIIYGNLHFNQSYKLELPCGSWVMFMPGGTMTADNYGNNSKQLKICGSAVWKGKDGAVSGPGGFGNPPLPIELLEFSASLSENKRNVDLSWITASELENDYFNVERSKDAESWEEVCQTNGAGNSSQLMFYEEKDYFPYTGISYYRLKQTDMNGDYSYSPIVSVNQAYSSEMFVYPNPTSKQDQIVVVLPENYSNNYVVAIFDMSGKMIAEFNRKGITSGQTIITLPSSISAGTYCISVGEERKLLVVQ